MADAVQETVHFLLTVQSIEHGGHWTTRALASSGKGRPCLMHSWPRAESTTSLAIRFARSMPRSWPTSPSSSFPLPHSRAFAVLSAALEDLGYHEDGEMNGGRTPRKARGH